MNDERALLLDALAPARLPPIEAGPPWWWLAVLLAALVLAAALLWLWRVRRRRREAERRAAALAWRAEAETALERLRERAQNVDRSVDPTGEPRAARAWLADASALARRVALVGQPRAAIAPLEGQAWLVRLRALGFDDGADGAALALLADAPYRREPSVTPEAVGQVCTALDALIEATACRRLAELDATPARVSRGEAPPRLAGGAR